MSTPRGTLGSSPAEDGSGLELLAEGDASALEDLRAKQELEVNSSDLHDGEPAPVESHSAGKSPDVKDERFISKTEDFLTRTSLDTVPQAPSLSQNAAAVASPSHRSSLKDGTDATASRKRNLEMASASGSHEPNTSICMSPKKVPRMGSATDVHAGRPRMGPDGLDQPTGAPDLRRLLKPVEDASEVKGLTTPTREGAKPGTAGGQAEHGFATPQRTTGEGAGDNESESDGDGEFDLTGMRKHEYEQVAKFGPEQLQRYEQYRRSDLKKEKIKKVLAAINPILAKSSDPFLIAVKGLAKVFVGDVVETALEVRDQCGEAGALKPKHMREAYRRIRNNGGLPSTTRRSRNFG